MIRNKAQVQDYLLGRLKNSSSDILEAAVISDDGLVLVSTSQNPVSRDKMAAFAASIFKPAQKAASDLEFEGISFVIVSGKERNMYLKELGNSQLLAVLVKSGANWENVQAHIITASDDLKCIAELKEKL